MLQSGARAPEFRLPVAGGGEQTLASLLASGPVLLAFYKVSCPTCQYTFPYLQRLASRGALRREGDPLQVVGVAQDGERSVAEFSGAYRITFPSLLDEQSSGYAVSNAYGIRTVPSLFLVGQDGEVASSVSGFVRAGIAGIGEQFGVTVFDPGEQVPDVRPG